MTQAAVVFIHGMWSQPGVWDHWLEPFAERGYACDALTLPGHGAGALDTELKGLGFAECLAAVERVCRRFDHPILVGHSMGGLLAQKLATTLSPRAVVLLNSAAPRAVFPLRGTNVRGLARHFLRWGLWRDVLRLSPAEADYLLFHGLDAPERAHAQAHLQAESGRLAYQLGWGRLGRCALHEVNPRAIRCPMLALAGRHDRMVPIQVSRAMARYYGPALDYREHDNAHWLLAERGYRARIAEVLLWLREQGAEARAANAPGGRA